MQDTDTNNPLDKKLTGEEIKRVSTDNSNQSPQLTKKEEEAVKDEIEEEVKESFQDEDVPVEPAVGNDGLEVGGEG